MWSLYRHAQTWSQKPSQILEINPAYAYLCWCFDDAVLFFGNWVEDHREVRYTAGHNRGKRKYTLAQILDPNFVTYGKRESKSLAGLLAMSGSFAGFVES